MVKAIYVRKAFIKDADRKAKKCGISVSTLRKIVCGSIKGSERTRAKIAACGLDIVWKEYLSNAREVAEDVALDRTSLYRVCDGKRGCRADKLRALIARGVHVKPRIVPKGI